MQQEMRPTWLYLGVGWRPTLLVVAMFSLQFAERTIRAEVIEPPQATGEISESILARIRSDAYPAWQSAVQATNSVKVTFREHEDYSYVDEAGRKGSRMLDSIVTICWDPSKSRRLTEVNNLGKGLNRRVLNNEYRFLVFQREGATEWTLGGGRRGNGTNEFRDFDGADDEFEWLLQASFRVAGIPVRDLVEGTGFKLTEARSMREPGSGNQESVVLRSSYDGPKTQWIEPPAEYWVILRPDNGWLIDRGGANFISGQTRVSTTVSYQPGLGGLPFPYLVTHDKVRANGDVKLHRTYQLEPPEQCDMPDTEFRLEHYGIPEAALDSRRGWSAVVLGALGLVALVLIYLVVRRISRRRPADV